MQTHLPFIPAIIIPTGVGAAIGGYAGDAMTLIKLFSEISDYVITHPNVANAASFQALPSNTLYVEGYALDQFFKGNWQLSPVRHNKIGVVLDAGISNEMHLLHQNVIAAVETTYGVDIINTTRTTEPLDIQLEITESGRSAGRVNNMQLLFDACDTLISQGATALALCCKLPVPEEDTYQAGTGVDPIGGLEAMISHAVVQHYQIPAAHAPVFDWDEAEPVRDQVLDHKIAAEYITPSFLPCVLQGLSKAPQYHFSNTSTMSLLQLNTRLSIGDLSVLIIPADCLGSVPTLSCLERNIPIIAVGNNTTVMACDTEAIEQLFTLQHGHGVHHHVIHARNYMEALGYCIKIKTGIKVPAHI